MTEFKKVFLDTSLIIYMLDDDYPKVRAAILTRSLVQQRSIKLQRSHSISPISRHRSRSTVHGVET